MKINIPRVIISIGLIACAIFLLVFQSISAEDLDDAVHIIQLTDDTINPVTAEYIIDAIDRASAEGAECLIIKLDTPGGLLNSTRSIVKSMLRSKVPIVVYIAPDGSRAGSAGVFITYASHIAVMAPSTNIGAAHPVQLGGGAPGKQGGDWQELRDLIEELKTLKDKNNDSQRDARRDIKDAMGTKDEIHADDDPMSSKILNDTVAFVKSIATTRNRNVEWAIKSVTESDSITAEEALELNVIEMISPTERDLLHQLNGRVVELDSGPVTLKTKNVPIKRVMMDSRMRFFNVLANPNIAYFLMILGFYGLLYEITHPGFGLPGIVGLVFLILAFYSMQTLPTNYAGLALFVLGLVLLVSEAFMPGFGLFAFAGLVCMVLGSMLLFESVDPIMRVSLSAIMAFSLTTTGITVFLVSSAVRSHRAKVHGGQEGLLRTKGEARSAMKAGTKGQVFVHGEIWSAVCDDDLKQDEEIIVTEINGLNLKVEKKKREA